jgi:hypothetical protein
MTVAFSSGTGRWQRRDGFQITFTRSDGDDAERSGRYLFIVVDSDSRMRGNVTILTFTCLARLYLMVD